MNLGSNSTVKLTFLMLATLTHRFSFGDSTSSKRKVSNMKQSNKRRTDQHKLSATSSAPHIGRRELGPLTVWHTDLNSVHRNRRVPLMKGVQSALARAHQGWREKVEVSTWWWEASKRYQLSCEPWDHDAGPTCRQVL